MPNRDWTFVALLASGARAADFKDVDPNVFPKDDPRAKELPGMMWADAKRRVQEANLRESKAFAAVKTKFGRVDFLFNNAGAGLPATSIEDVTPAQWRSIVDVNLNGMFYCTRAAFRMMKDQTPQGGRIVNNGSISAHVPRPGSVAYTATKHAVTGLTRSTSLDGRKYDIACGQVDIGNAATEMTARMAKGVPQANGTMAVEPTMAVENVGKTVALMASLPLDANIQFVTVMSTKMPFIGRG
jgi:NAD(P)-dependent dehydrogenase (short-subunit alcohol dehydrogenase family)